MISKDWSSSVSKIRSYPSRFNIILVIPHASRNSQRSQCFFTALVFAFDITLCARVSSRQSRGYRLLSDSTTYTLVVCFKCVNLD